MFIVINLLGVICIVSVLMLFLLMIIDFFSGLFFIPMFVFFVSYLMVIKLFCKKANKYPLNDVSEYFVPNIKKLLIGKENDKSIYFKKDGEFWVCENNQQVIKLKLSGYLYKKSYLVSYVIRNLRYPIISNKLSWKYLFSNSFHIRKNLNLKLIIIDGNKRFEKTIVKNGVSKYGIIAKNITISPFYSVLFFNRSYHGLRNNVSYIDERIYKRYADRNSL